MPGVPQFTISAAVSSFSTLLGLKVFVVTGANESGGAAAGSAGSYGVISDSLTPAATGSLILFGLAQVTGTYTAYTAASNNTLVDNLQEGATGAGYGDGYYSGTVTAATPVTVGASAPASSWTASGAYELRPVAGTTTPLIDASTPALAHGTSSPSTTPLAPPAGAVLVAVVMGNVTGSSGTVTVTDTLGGGLVWTQRGLYQFAYEGVVGIFTTTIPGGGAVAPSAPAGAGAASFGPQVTLAMAGAATLGGAGASAAPSAATAAASTVTAGAASGSGVLAQPTAGLALTFSQTMVISFTAG